MENMKCKDYIFRLFRECFAIIVWIYFLGKIAIFDFESFVIHKYFPNLEQVLYYRFFILVAIGFILWISLGKKKFYRFSLYVIVYPIVILVWKIPKNLFSHWSVSLLFAPTIFEFVTKFRAYLIINTLVVLSAIFILTSNNKILLSISMLILASFLAYHLYSSFCKAYRSTVFSKLQEIIHKVKNRVSDKMFFQKMWNNAEKRTKPKKDEEEVQTRISTLYMAYWCAEFLKEKATLFLESRKMDLYLILTWFWTVFITVIVYSLEYFSLYKIHPDSFSVPYEPNFLSFLGFSFGKLATSEVSAISPKTSFALILCYSELCCTLIIFVILVFTILTAARERYREEIYNLVSELTEVALVIEEKFTIIFNMALSEAEYLLLTNNATLVNGLRKLRGLPELSHPDLEKPEQPKDKDKETEPESSNGLKAEA